MNKPIIPQEEELRLSELYAYRILDTEEEEDFDFITEMAAKICETKYATITLVDKNRQWFKSKVGFEVRETPLEESFCAVAIHSGNDFFEVPNSHLDARFCDYPNVQGDPNITFYASYPLVSDTGRILGTLCVADDEEKTLRSEQKKALKSLSNQVMRLIELRKRNFELRQNQTYYQSLIENTHGSPYRAKNDGNQTLVFLTKGFEKITGYEIGDFLHNPEKSFKDIIHPDDQKKVREAKEKAIQENGQWEIQYRILHSSGFVKWIDERGKAYKSELTRESYIDGILLDISFRKNEEVLFKNIFDNSQGLICIHDFSGKIIKINGAASESLGYGLDEVIGKNIREFLNEYDYPMIEQYMEEIKKRGRHKGILRLRSKNGINKYWAYDNSVADFGGTKDIVVTNSVDISDKIRMEKALSATEERLQLIAQSIDDAYYVYNVSKENYEYFSPNSEKVIGVNLDFFFEGLNFNETYVHEEDRAKCQEAAKKLHEGEAYNIEFRTVINGKTRWLNEKAFPVTSGLNSEIRVAGRVTDVTQRKNIQLELENTKEILEQASKTARVGAWEVDLIEKKIHWSKVMKEIHEVDENFELKVENSLSFFKKGFNRNKASEGFDLLIKKDKPLDLDLLITDAKGKEKWVRLIGKAQFKMGSCIRLYGTLQDVNDIRKKTAELVRTKQQLESILSEMEDVVWAIKLPLHKMLFITPSVEHFFEIKLKASMQDPDFWKSFVHPEDAHIIEEITEELEDGDFYEKEHRIITSKGTTRWVYHTGKIIYDAQATPIRLDVKMMDITKDKDFEKQLIAETNRANAASKSKSEFLANMSHEIRTPLNGVIGFTDLLLKTDLSGVQQQYADNAHTAGKSLLNLINDILDFSKIEAGKLDLDPIETNLEEILYETLDIIKFPAGQKNLEIILDLPPTLPESVLIDPHRLKQILINLLNNAIKFTEKGHVILQVREVVEVDGPYKLEFTVIDTGIGIPEEVQKKLFQAFSQADSSTTRKFGGTGLGLTISNLLAEKMGGNIGVDSKPGHGSAFYFTIDAEVKKPFTAFTELRDKDIKILLVDDHESVRTIAKKYFGHFGFTCDTAANGLEAYHFLSQNKDYDLALVDYHMPYVDGVQVIEKIRQELSLTPDTLPIMIMGYFSDSEHLRKSIDRLQINKFIQKPIHYKNLINLLSKSNIREVIKSEIEADASGKLEGQFTILVAEDISMNMLLLKTLLNNLLKNVKVLECANGKIAVENYRLHEVDLIFMDVQMPEMDGLTATKAIRVLESQSVKKVPIVALTAGALKEEQMKCYEAGMDDFLTKPIQPESLKNTLEKHLLQKQTSTLISSESSVLVSFNKPKLMQLIDNHLPLLKELLITSRDLSEKIQEIKSMLDQEDREGIKANAHYIRGASQSMGFDLLAAITETIELTSSKAEIQELTKLWENLDKEWTELVLIIDKEIDNLSEQV
ncbi:PAS domain-containing protein [Arthrospiribacter ruber]|uniref:Sensory/regulatory protein RpfC n=1 Tax=Arthrospiribacter ruber TaxID=2487934 RepID=A0A951IYM8_9BACT|nr:PAS domain-containing protein [Arthrospiribacter ruber]MBW3468574.1 response regulator [Arthrospiribacter ruber]